MPRNCGRRLRQGDLPITRTRLSTRQDYSRHEARRHACGDTERNLAVRVSLNFWSRRYQPISALSPLKILIFLVILPILELFSHIYISPRPLLYFLSLEQTSSQIFSDEFCHHFKYFLIFFFHHIIDNLNRS